MLSTNKKMFPCASVIGIGKPTDQSHAFIIGRPLRGERSLSRQLVTVHVPDNNTQFGQFYRQFASQQCDLREAPFTMPREGGRSISAEGPFIGLSFDEHETDG
ncbi:unnamed protein product, partial [Iphiclides podalirius]